MTAKELYFIVILSTPWLGGDCEDIDNSPDAPECECGTPASVYALAAALAIVTASLLLVLLKERCQQRWSPNRSKTHQEDALLEQVVDENIVGKMQSIFSESKISLPTELTSINGTYTSRKDNEPHTSTLIKSCKQTPMPPPKSKLNQYREHSENVCTADVESKPAAVVSTSEDDHKLNMMKDCFGEASKKAKKATSLNPAEGGDISTSISASSEDVTSDIYRSTGDLDKPKTLDAEKSHLVTMLMKELVKVTGDMSPEEVVTPEYVRKDSKKASKEKLTSRPTSTIVENDLYVTADAVDHADSEAGILRRTTAAHADTVTTPVLRPPTAFISDSEVNAVTAEVEVTAGVAEKAAEARVAEKVGEDESDYVTMSTMPAICEASNDASPMEKTCVTEGGDSDEDASEHIYDLPSPMLRKVRLVNA